MAEAERQETARRIGESLKRQLGEFFPLLTDLDVIEILLNADGTVWVDRLSAGMSPVGAMTASAAETFIMTVATTSGDSITRDRPVLECELPRWAPFDGSRFAAIIRPVTSAPIFSIRRKAVRIFKIDDYVARGIMTHAQKRLIEQAVLDRANILVIGGTTTGKTTLVNAIIAEMVRTTPAHRIVIIEDTAELQCAAENSAILRANELVDMQRLLKATLRLRPDRIIVGEVRGAEVLTMLDAWNTGHPGGICTVHANNAVAGLTRVERLMVRANVPPSPELIAEAVDMIVAIERIGVAPGRRISEIVAVKGYKNGEYILEHMEN